MSMQAFQQLRDSLTAVFRELADIKHENAELRRRVADLERQQTEPPRRGRPPKDKEAQ